MLIEVHSTHTMRTLSSEKKAWTILILCSVLALMFAPAGLDARKEVDPDVPFTLDPTEDNSEISTSDNLMIIIKPPAGQALTPEAMNVVFLMDEQLRTVSPIRSIIAPKLGESAFVVGQSLLGDYFGVIFYAVVAANVTAEVYWEIEPFVDDYNALVDGGADVDVALNESRALHFNRTRAEIYSYGWGSRQKAVAMRGLDSMLATLAEIVILTLDATNHTTELDVRQCIEANMGLVNASIPSDLAAAEDVILDIAALSVDVLGFAPFEIEQRVLETVTVALFGADTSYDGSTLTPFETVDRVYSQGNSSTFGNQLKEDLLALLRGDLLFPGIEKNMVTGLLSLYTDSDGSTAPTLLLSLVEIETGLTEEESNSCAICVIEIIEDMRESYSDYEFMVGGNMVFCYELDNQIPSDVSNVERVQLTLLLIFAAVFTGHPLLVLAFLALAMGVIGMGNLIIVNTPWLGFELDGVSLIAANGVILGALMNFFIFADDRFRKSGGFEDPERGRKAIYKHVIPALVVSGLTLSACLAVTIISDVGISHRVGIAGTVGMLLALGFGVMVLPHVFEAYGHVLRRVPIRFRKYLAFKPRLTLPGRRLTAFVSTRPKAVVIAAAAILALALVSAFLVPFDYGMNVSVPRGTESSKTMKTFDDQLSSGLAGAVGIELESDVSLLANNNTVNWDYFHLLSDFTELINGTDGIHQVYSPTHPFGKSLGERLNSTAPLHQGIGLFAMAKFIGGSRFVSLYAVVSGGPLSAEAIQLTREIIVIVRDFAEVNNLNASISGVGVTLALIGDTAYGEFPLILFLAIIGVFIILGVAFRGVGTPLRLVSTVIWGNTVAAIVAHLGWFAFDNAGVYWILPLMSTVVVLGLGLDFEVFLMYNYVDRLKEAENRTQAMEEANEQAWNVIGHSGIIMALAYLALVISSSSLLVQFGLILFLAILVDTFVVRPILVPALIILFDRHRIGDRDTDDLAPKDSSLHSNSDLDSNPNPNSDSNSISDSTDNQTD